MTQPASDQNRKTILIVEDEPSMRVLMARKLGRMGYEVLQAQNGEEALKLADERQGRLELVITDVVMPRMNGFVLVQRLLQSYPDVKVLFMSGHADHEARLKDGLAKAGQPFIMKPFTPDQLQRAIELALEGPFDDS